MRCMVWVPDPTGTWHSADILPMEASTLLLTATGRSSVILMASWEWRQKSFCSLMANWWSEGCAEALLCPTPRPRWWCVLDVGFGDGGRVVVEIQPEVSGPHLTPCLWRNVALQQNGKILLSGHVADCPPNAPNRIRLLRFKTEGTLDSQFGNAGHVFTELDPGYSESWGTGRSE